MKEGREHADAVVIGAGEAGLAAAKALLDEGIAPVLLEAGDAPVGSWPGYYDGLTLFTPARHSALPGMPFPGDPDRYPSRDEVAAYLAAYAARLDADIRCGHRVTNVRHHSGAFNVDVEGGRGLTARIVIAATGTFGNPHRPPLPGLDRFEGEVLHAAEYRSPEPYAGRRAVVVGAGSSGVEIACELAALARTTIAARGRARFAPQRPLGRELHDWYRLSGFDAAPLGYLLQEPPPLRTPDDGRYRRSLNADAPDLRPMFTELTATGVVWSDGSAEQVDLLVLSTGYRPALDFLSGLGVLGAEGRPRHRGGIATGISGLGFVGLEWQRSRDSASLRGVGRDARHVARRLKHQVQEAEAI